jgi:hypothetical protein
MHFEQESVAAPHPRSQTQTGNQLWPSLITEVRTFAVSSEIAAVGSPVDGIKDVVGPMVALLDIRSDFALGGFVRQRVCFRGL